MENPIKKNFFNKLAEKLEEQFKKGEICSCGERLEARSHALAFNAYANVYLAEALTDQKKESIKITNRLLDEHKEYLLKQVEKIIDEYCSHIDACYGGDNLAEIIKDRLKKLK